MAIRIGINGFGRIGRLVVRAAVRRGIPLDFVAVNDLTDAKTLAHLLRFDSVHGVWDDARLGDDSRVVAGRHQLEVLSEKDPEKLPWKKLGVDIVLEATGHFTDRAGGAKHQTAGARSVLISAPAKGVDLTFVIGVNDDQFDKARHTVVSIGSCTTNCLAPMAKVLNDTFGIEHGLMTTIHAYTNDQRILDTPHKDLRRARAAAMSLIPTSTGAAKAIGQVLPELQGKLDGLAVRAPVPCGSLTDLVCRVAKPASVEAVNAAMRAAADGRMQGVLHYETAPIVSSDIVTNPASCVFDSPLTSVMEQRLVKVLGWYDNEWGFSNRVVDALVMMG